MLKNVNPMLLFFLSASLFGLFTITFLTLYPPVTMESVSWRKPLVGSVFELICVSGMMAAFSPQKCSETFDSRKTEKQTSSHMKASSFSGNVRGHHPDCGKFSAHTIRLNGRVLCAACTGLVLGALIVLSATVLYFFVDWSYERVSPLAVSMGQVGIVLGLVQMKFKGVVRLMMNVFFVLGAYLVLMGMDAVFQNVFIDFYVVGLILMWLWTRIMLSEWDHWRICHACKSSC